MDSRSFRPKIDLVNKRWLSKQLNISYNHKGIDFLNDRIGIELKSYLDYGNHPKQVAIKEYQITDFVNDDRRKYYWAIMRYTLEIPVRAIRRDSTFKTLENLVEEREVHIVPWDWVFNFPIHDLRTGPYRYIHKRYLDELDMLTIDVEKGKIHMPEDLNAILFQT